MQKTLEDLELSEEAEIIVLEPREPYTLEVRCTCEDNEYEVICTFCSVVEEV